MGMEYEPLFSTHEASAVSKEAGYRMPICAASENYKKKRSIFPWLGVCFCPLTVV